jgi:hypothetical protein
MKKKIVSLFFFVTCTFSLMGQNKTNTLPTYYVVVDSAKIKVSSKQLKRAHFNPEWIESIEIVKQPKFDGVYGNDISGVIVIYIKQEYNQEVLNRLKKLKKRKTLFL